MNNRIQDSLQTWRQGVKVSKLKQNMRIPSHLHQEPQWKKSSFDYLSQAQMEIFALIRDIRKPEKLNSKIHIEGGILQQKDLITDLGHSKQF